MRLLILDTCYPPFLRSHYARNQGLARQPYGAQWRALMDTFFGTADSYSHALGELGHEAHEVVANCRPLQEAWVREQGRGGRRLLPFRFQRERVVDAQAQEYRPDVVYVQNMRFFSTGLRRRLRRRGATIVGQIASEPPSRSTLRAYDLVLTSFPHFVDRFRAAGVQSEYLRIGFDPRALEQLESDGVERELHGAVFVGALNRTQHRSGNAQLERAARRAPIEFWGYGATGWPPGSPIRERYRGEAWGLDMLRVLYESKLALNRHIGVAEQNANNMRLYEATGVGTLLLTDRKDNLIDLFEPGREVVAYTDEDDLVEQVHWYLEHDEQRRAIARAGQERTLRDHTYRRRMEELLSILRGSAGR
jgi:spore maturation protein CgeB